MARLGGDIFPVFVWSLRCVESEWEVVVEWSGVVVVDIPVCTSGGDRQAGRLEV